MLGPYQLRELRRQLTSLVLLLGFLWLTVYVASDFDLLQTYRRMTDRNWVKPAPVQPAPVDNGESPPTVVPTAPAPSYGSFFGNKIVYLSGINSDSAEMRYYISGHTETVRSFCSRLTIYSSIGNFSLIESHAEPKEDGSGCVVIAKWKRHRDDVVNPSGGPFRFLKGAFKNLCPVKYSDTYSDCNESSP